MNQNIVDNNQKKYNKLLQELIPNLDKYSYLSGTEGNVYFVHDDYVVKEYYNSHLSIEFFQKFYNEVKTFAEQGYALPKFYAWEYVSINPPRKSFYILEERVKGKTLFNEMEDIYPKVQHLCSKDEFNHAIFHCSENPKLFSEIIIAYLSDINDTAKSLYNMPEDKLELFITTLYHIYLDSMNSFPDIHENNIMFDGKNLTIIDQMPIEQRYHKFKPENDYLKTQIVYDIFAIFEKFSMIEHVKIYDISLQPRFERIKQETLKNATSVLVKFNKKCKKMLFPNENLKSLNYHEEASFLFQSDVAKKLAEELEKE